MRSSTIDNDEINELVAMYASGKTGKRVWFTRRMNKLPEETQDKVWTKLGNKGFEKPTPRAGINRKPRTPREHSENGEEIEARIRWTDEEWDKLADLIWTMRRKDPNPPLLQLINRAQMQLPEGRRRNINTGRQEPLLVRLKQKDQAIADEAAEAGRLRDRIEGLKQAPDKQAILENLNDDEIDLLFKSKVLDLTTPEEIFSHFSMEHLLGGIPISKLAALTIERTLASVDGQNQDMANLTSLVSRLVQRIGNGNGGGSKQAAPVARARRQPKVTILGMLPGQTQVVQQKLGNKADLNFVDKKRKSDVIPDNQDIIVLWTNFMSHVLFDHAKKAKEKGAHLIYHEGGVEKMIEKIDAALTKLK